jgi:hypothetical protein
MSQISNLPLDTENTRVQEESSISTNATGAFPSKADSHQSAFGPGTDILVMTAAVIGGVSFMGREGNVVGLVARVERQRPFLVKRLSWVYHYHTDLCRWCLG